MKVNNQSDSRVVSCSTDLDFNPLIECFKGANRIVITTHVNSDGDGVGSEFALAHYFKSIRKEVKIINPTTLHSRFDFIRKKTDFYLDFNQQNESFISDFLSKTDLIIFVDMNTIARSGKLEPYLKRSPARTACLDHHPTNNKFTDILIADEKSFATGHLVYKLLKTVNTTLTYDIAECIYVSMIADTGNFKYDNTTPETHRIAAEFLERFNLKPYSVFEKLFHTKNHNTFRLVSALQEQSKVELDGKLIYTVVPLKMVHDYSANDDELGDIVDTLRSVKNVEVSIVFIETPENMVRINFRSRGVIDVNALAKKFGGGGHIPAAGARVQGKLDEVVEHVLEISKKYITEQWARNGES